MNDVVINVVLWIANFLQSIIQAVTSIFNVFGKVLAFLGEVFTILPAWLLPVPIVFLACSIIYAILKN